MIWERKKLTISGKAQVLNQSDPMKLSQGMPVKYFEICIDTDARVRMTEPYKRGPVAPRVKVILATLGTGNSSPGIFLRALDYAAVLEPWSKTIES
jgi:hypothetical protein